jgi:hypothetical protein
MSQESTPEARVASGTKNRPQKPAWRVEPNETSPKQVAKNGANDYWYTDFWPKSVASKDKPMVMAGEASFYEGLDKLPDQFQPNKVDHAGNLPSTYDPPELPTGIVASATTTRTIKVWWDMCCKFDVDFGTTPYTTTWDTHYDTSVDPKDAQIRGMSP